MSCVQVNKNSIQYHLNHGNSNGYDGGGGSGSSKSKSTERRMEVGKYINTLRFAGGISVEPVNSRY